MFKAEVEISPISVFNNNDDSRTKIYVLDSLVILYSIVDIQVKKP